MNNLNDRIRAADPEAGRPLSARVVAGLDDILSGRRLPREVPTPPGLLSPGLPTPRRWRPFAIACVGLGVAATFMIVAVVMLSVLRPQAAVAATPQPLQITSTEETLESLREKAQHAEVAPSGAESTRGATWEGWYIQLDADKPSATYIQPQRTELEWSPDFSGTSRVIAGAPVTPGGTPTDGIPATAAAPGATLYEVVWKPGEHVPPFLDTPPDDTVAMRAYLTAYLSEQRITDSAAPTADECMFALASLLQIWTLSDAAQRAAVEVVLDAPGTEVVGATTDRAGRDGVVLSVPATALEAGYRTQIVIDIERWRFLAVERTTIDGLPDFGIPAGSVTSYTLWR